MLVPSLPMAKLVDYLGEAQVVSNEHTGSDQSVEI